MFVCCHSHTAFPDFGLSSFRVARDLAACSTNISAAQSWSHVAVCQWAKWTNEAKITSHSLAIKQIFVTFFFSMLKLIPFILWIIKQLSRKSALLNCTHHEVISFLFTASSLVHPKTKLQIKIHFQVTGIPIVPTQSIRMLQWTWLGFCQGKNVLRKSATPIYCSFIWDRAGETVLVCTSLSPWSICSYWWSSLWIFYKLRKLYKL